MSDPVSKTEIEDVLLSIRRLVSEETRSQPRPEPVRQPPEENRLVLTPSLRVLDDIVETLPLVDEDEFTQQADDKTPWNNPDATLYNAAQIKPETVSETVVDVADTVDPGKITEELPADPANDAVDQDDTPPSVFVMTHEAHGINVDPMPEADKLVPGDAVLADKTAGDDLQLSAELGHHEDTSSKDADLDNLTPLSAKIAALETAIGETQDQWEPDGAAGDDYAGTTVQTLRWQDHHEVEEPVSVVSEGEGPAGVQETPDAAEQNFEADDDDTSDLDFLVGDDGIMDEESLRELVADIVREELQGALGERITRNVRKLVRREIQRALTTQQLD